MLLFTQLEAGSSYVHVLVGLVAMGIGMGSIMPASFQIATLGVSPRQAGAASAMVSTSQQVGGAIGTAVLNTIAATAAAAYVTDHAPATPQIIADGALHSFSVAYLWSAGIFLTGAVVAGSLFRNRADRAARAAAAAASATPSHDDAPVLAH